MKHITHRERVLDFFGIVIAARIHGRFGSVWDNIQSEGQQQKVNYLAYMKQYQFQQIRDVIPYMWASPEEKQNDDWWMINCCVEEFNKNRKQNVNASFMQLMDKSMSAFCLQT